MSEMLFDLVILNHTSDKSVENLVQDLLVILDKTGDPYLEYKLSEALLFEQSSSAVLNQISQTAGREYQEKFQELRVETALRPTLQMVAKEPAIQEESEEQYVCPACNHTQAKQKDTNVMDTCDKCGRVGEKLEKHQRKEEIFQLEKRKLEKKQKKQLAEATERANYEEAEALRQEARKKLGVTKSKKNVAGILLSLGIVGVICIGTYFLVTSMRDTEETEPADETLATTENGEKQPLVTIQGGNGSIVVSNANEAGANSNGKGGAKGTTGNKIETTNAANTSDSTNVAEATTTDKTSSGNQGSDTDQTALSGGSTNPSLAEGTATIQNATDVSQNTQNTSGKNTDKSTSTSLTTAQTQQDAKQLAMLSPATVDTQSTINHAVTLSGRSTASSTKTTSKNNITTSQNELSFLQSILHSEESHDHSNNIFSKVNRKQFAAHKKRLQRLLNLGKPSLALIFAEGIEDPYAASLLILEIAKHEAKVARTTINDELLVSLKGLSNKSSSASQKAMINASLGQLYHSIGNKESAKAILNQSMHSLHTDSAKNKHQCHLLAQIAQNHHDFSEENGENFYNSTLISFINKLPKKEYVQTARIYAHLAAAALKENNRDEAAEWLKQIPARDAQKHLLTQLEILIAAADKNNKRKN